MGAGPDVTHCRLRRFLHDITQLAGERQLTTAFHERYFGRQDFAAHLGPRQSGHQTYFVLGFLLVVSTELRDSQVFAEVVRRDPGLVLLALPNDRSRHLSANGRDFPFQVPNAGFARVTADDPRDAFVIELQLFLAEAGCFQLFRNQESLGDFLLFFLCVPGDTQYLHSVLHGLGDCMKDICGRYEHDLGQIVVHIEIVIVEGRVLFRIEDFQQCGSRISPEIHRHLVYFIQQEDRVHGAGLFDHLNDLTRQGSDIRSAVSPDLGFIPDPTQREPDELAAGRTGNRHSKRSFTNSRRAGKAQYRAFGFLDQLAYGEELQNSIPSPCRARSGLRSGFVQRPRYL